MHKKKKVNYTENVKEVQIGSLATAYRLRDNTINSIVRAIGARLITT
jgi:hypothetical protein